MPEMSACVYIVQWLQGPDTTEKLPHDTQKGQPNAIPKISMLSLLSITAQLSSMHQSRIIFIIYQRLFHNLFLLIELHQPECWPELHKEHTGLVLVLGQWHLNTIVNFCEL